jgi:hypothetical protein
MVDPPEPMSSVVVVVLVSGKPGGSNYLPAEAREGRRASPMRSARNTAGVTPLAPLID